MPEDKIKLEAASKIDELSGKMASQMEEDKLMHSVMESDKKTVDDGKLIAESINQGLGSFTPDLMFEKMVQDYKNAKKLFGETIIRELSGYDPNFVEKNLTIPEFRKEVKENMEEKIEIMKKEKLLDKDGRITSKGFKLSAMILYIDELNHIVPKGLGKKVDKKKSQYGDVKDITIYKKQKYNDISMRNTLKVAIRRGHEQIQMEDLRMYERQRKGKITIVYGMDSSGSMKGNKLGLSKKAGVALAFRAIQEKNKVGIIVFDSEIKKVIEPCTDFSMILEELNKVRAGMETNLKLVVEKAMEIFPKGSETKHLLLLTDALPTKGKEPKNETLKAVSAARNEGITISLVGIDLDEEGLELAKKVTEVGNGKLYLVKDVANLDRIVLEDYYSTVAG